MKKLLFLVLIGAGFTSLAQSVKDFALKDVNGKVVHLSDYNSNAGVVIIFTSNACPFDDYYIERIKNIKSTNVPVLLVNSGLEDVESATAMASRAQQKGITQPYLADKDQLVLQDLNAHKSTEVFLLKNNGGKFSIYYHGAIDDNPQVAADVKHAYLTEAISTMLDGKALSVPDNRPVGCVIRRK
jgi:peroxiredoxin